MSNENESTVGYHHGPPGDRCPDSGSSWESYLSELEQRLRNGERPEVQDVVSHHCANRERHLLDVISTFLDYLIRECGEERRVEEYLPHFGDNVPESVLEELILIEAVSRRDSRSSEPSEHILADLQGRFPDVDFEKQFPKVVQAMRAQYPQIPGFPIFHEIGKGAFGVVYEARQSSLCRKVALKRIRANCLIPGRRESWERECEVLAALEHPNIIQVYDSRIHEGDLYLVLEHASQGDLASTLGTAWDPRKAAETVAELAEAVAFAHSKGCHHRDIKPANVLLDGAGRLKIIDFGLARLVHASDPKELGREGDPIGTPCYMAPEQASGNLSRIDHSTDVFLLGATLYHLLTGHAPYEGRSLRATLEKAAKCEFDPVQERRANVPEPLCEICHKAMNENPAHRYLASEMATALKDWIKESEATPAPTPLWKPIALGMAVLVVAILGFVFWKPASGTPGGNGSSKNEGGIAQKNGLLELVVRGEVIQKNQEERMVLRSGMKLKSGDQFRIRLQVSRDCYVYVVNLDSRQNVNLLFPQNPAKAEMTKANVERELPKGMNWFTLDDNPGMESLYLIATRTPLENPGRLQDPQHLDALLQKLRNEEQELLAVRGIEIRPRMNQENKRVVIQATEHAVHEIRFDHQR